MQHDTQFEAANVVPQWLPPTEARKQLKAEIDRFVGAAAAATAEPEAALALRVTAGLGKTGTALRIIAHHGESLLARGHVLIYAPTLALAERAHEEFRALAPELPSRVIRGRSAMRPDDPEKSMCERADSAREISGIVPSVTQALCRSFDPDGTYVQSPCASGCPYLEQKDAQGAHVIFLSHPYLTIAPPIDHDTGIALRVVDEKVWPSLTRTWRLSIEDLMRAAPKSFPERLHGILARAKAAIVDGLQRDLPLFDHLRQSDISAEQLQELARAENRTRDTLDIAPWQSEKKVAYRIATFDKRAFVASRRRGQVFKNLSESDTGHCVGLTLAEAEAEGGQNADRWVECSWIECLPRDAPLLLLDADAAPEIIERIAPGAAFASLQSPPIADIVQVSDRTLSGTWLLHPEKGGRRRAAVLTILKREVDRAANGGVLVVATKSVLAALHRDVGHSIVRNDDNALKQPLFGAEPRWFGPRTQGVNDYEKFATVVVVGRLQPSTTDIETSTRAVFSRDAAPVEAHRAGPLPATNTSILMADGSVEDVVARTHPDHRARVLLAQTRECGTLQAIARLRLLSPNREKRVVILSSQPLPEFPVTRLCTFAALERDLEHEKDWQGFARMETALQATKGRPVRGARLSAIGLAEDLPLDFETVSSAKRFRRGCPTSDLVSLCQRVAVTNGWSITLLRLRRFGGGKAVPAIILDAPIAPLAAARSLWPDFMPEFA